MTHPVARLPAHVLTVLRVLALLVVAAWLLGSAARGGLRSAWTALAFEVRHPALWSSVQPDAREQWRGPYLDALTALQRERPDPEATVAIVLPESERPDFQSVPTRLYEAIYRLYPLKPNFYLRDPAGVYHRFWFRPPRKAQPQGPPLLQHDYLIWAEAPTAQLSGYRAVYRNEAATVYLKVR